MAEISGLRTTRSKVAISWLASVFWIFLGGSSLEAQSSQRATEHDARAWYMYFADHSLGDRRFGFHFDGQLRIEDAAGRRRQLLLRPGINFDVNENLQLSGGYAFIDSQASATSTGFNQRENRLWQQVIVKQRLGSVRLAHRYRLEQRFVRDVATARSRALDSDRSRRLNRARYFLKGTIPLPGASRYYAAFYNELMIGFGKNVKNNVFDQNRSYGAFGVRLHDRLNLELGYLLQIVQSPSGSLVQYNHTFQVGLFSR